MQKRWIKPADQKYHQFIMIRSLKPVHQNKQTQDLFSFQYLDIILFSTGKLLDAKKSITFLKTYSTDHPKHPYP